MAGLPIDYQPYPLETAEMAAPTGLSTGRAAESVPPSGGSPLPISPGFFDRLKAGDKKAWEGIATIAFALADIGEIGKPPAQRRQKTRVQEYREGLRAQQELEGQQQEREERRGERRGAAAVVDQAVERGSVQQLVRRRPGLPHRCRDIVRRARAPDLRHDLK